MIKVIFFDLDGVLTTDAKGSLTMSKNLCEMVPGLSVQNVLDCYREDIEALNMGRISMRDVWKRMCATFSIPESNELLKEMMRKVPRNDAILILRNLYSANTALGLLLTTVMSA